MTIVHSLGLSRTPIKSANWFLSYDRTNKQKDTLTEITTLNI